MDFPLTGLMDEDACSDRLVGALHPDGSVCPRCGSDRLGMHQKQRAPVLDYRCRDCRRVFNTFTGIALQKTNRRPSTLVLILRGVAQGVPTARLARELGCDRMKLLDCRTSCRTKPWPGRTRPLWLIRWSKPTNATSMRGKKGIPHREPDDPPRRRANKRRGHGTFANDRPPVAATIGRESGRPAFTSSAMPIGRRLRWWCRKPRRSGPR